MLAALLVACGEKPAVPPPPPPPPAIVDLEVTPRSMWDSLMLKAAEALRTDRNVPVAEIRAVRDRLMKFHEEPGKGDPNSGHGALPGPSRAVRLYLLGELAARMNDAHGLQAAVDSLLGPPLVGSSLPRKPMTYAMGLQAIQLLRMGDTTRALERMDSVVAAIPDTRWPMLWVGGTLDRPRRIEWLRKAGKGARADSLMMTITKYNADKLIRP